MLKWKLLITTLPFVALVTLIKVVLEFVFHHKGFVEFSDVGVVLTAGVFLSGILLGGTMSDYKESEKLPAELAITLEGIEELFVFAGNTRPAVAVQDYSREVLKLTDAVKSWLIGTLPTPEIFAALTAFNEPVRRLEVNGAGADAGRVLQQLTALRKIVSRVDVIRRTSFLPPAYALLETLLVMILLLLLNASFKSYIGEFIIVPVVTLVNAYMIRLIKDVDDPFDYAPDGKKRGGAEVELFPLTEYRERLASRVGVK